jgi:hypothetical protein
MPGIPAEPHEVQLSNPRLTGEMPEGGLAHHRSAQKEKGKKPNPDLVR